MGVDLGLIEWFKHFPAHSTCFLNSMSCHPHLTCNLWHAAVQFLVLTQVLSCNSDPVTLFLSYFLFLKFLCSPSDIGISWHWNGYLSSSFIFDRLNTKMLQNSFFISCIYPPFHLNSLVCHFSGIIFSFSSIFPYRMLLNVLFVFILSCSHIISIVVKVISASY